MSYSKPKDIADFLISKNIGGPQTNFFENDPLNKDIEVNSGVEFPGVQFDCLLDKT